MKISMQIDGFQLAFKGDIVALLKPQVLYCCMAGVEGGEGTFLTLNQKPLTLSCSVHTCVCIHVCIFQHKYHSHDKEKSKMVKLFSGTINSIITCIKNTLWSNYKNKYIMTADFHFCFFLKVAYFSSAARPTLSVTS